MTADLVGGLGYLQVRFSIVVRAVVVSYIAGKEFRTTVAIGQNLGADTWKTLNKGFIVPNSCERRTFLLQGLF